MFRIFVQRRSCSLQMPYLREDGLVAMGIGAGIGGLTISQYGIETALWIDSVTFLVAIVLIMTLLHGGPEKSGRLSSNPRAMLEEILSGWKYILSKPSIRRVVLAKAMWASGGGAQVFLLILIGREAGFGDVVAGIGILYMARGFGSGFGPIVSRRFMSNDRLVPYLLGGVLIISGAFYMAVAVSEWTMIILVYVFISHMLLAVSIGYYQQQCSRRGVRMSGWEGYSVLTHLGSQ